MKRLIAVILMAGLLCSGICFAGNAIANPWRETTAEELVETLGLSFHEPEGAEDVVYRMLEGESLGEMQFVLNGMQCIARIKPATEFEDISGMYYEWSSIADCEILWCPGEVMQITAEGRSIALCQWYDVVPGLMYSVSADAAEGNEPDILALAGALFDPAQGDADAAPADLLAGALSACTGYMGTAGSSLKEAMAAVGLLEFAVNDFIAEDMEEIIPAAVAALSDEQKQELAFSIESIAMLMESAFADYDSMAGLFDDAGVAETMQTLIGIPDAQPQWTALCNRLQAELNP